MSLTGMTVLYDETCGLCRRSAHWLANEKAHIHLDILAAGSPAARERFGDIPALGDDLVVVGDDGRVWWGSPDAYIMAMWALRKWRPWAIRLSRPGMSRLAEAVFKRVSTHRRAIGALLGEPYCADCVASPVSSERL